MTQALRITINWGDTQFDLEIEQQQIYGQYKQITFKGSVREILLVHQKTL